MTFRECGRATHHESVLLESLFNFVPLLVAHFIRVHVIGQVTVDSGNCHENRKVLIYKFAQNLIRLKFFGMHVAVRASVQTTVKYIYDTVHVVHREYIQYLVLWGPLPGFDK